MTRNSSAAVRKEAPPSKYNPNNLPSLPFHKAFSLVVNACGADVTRSALTLVRVKGNLLYTTDAHRVFVARFDRLNDEYTSDSRELIPDEFVAMPTFGGSGLDTLYDAHLPRMLERYPNVDRVIPMYAADLFEGNAPRDLPEKPVIEISARKLRRIVRNMRTKKIAADRPVIFCPPTLGYRSCLKRIDPGAPGEKLEEIKAELPADVEITKSLGLKPTYLLQALEAIEFVSANEPVRIYQQGDEFSPVTMQHGPVLTLTVPVRI